MINLNSILKFFLVFVVSISISNCFGQEKEFKDINSLIKSAYNEKNPDKKNEQVRELIILAVDLNKKHPLSPLGYYARSHYYNLTRSNADSAFFLMKKALNLVLTSDEKTETKLCEKFIICKDSLNKSLDFLSNISFLYYSQSLENLEIYLNKYPDDVTGHKYAQEKVIELNYNRINNSMNQYNFRQLSDEFSKRFPNSKYADSIISKVEYFEFLEVKNNNSIQDFDKFSSKYPNFKFNKEISILKEKRIFNSCQSRTDYEDFIKLYMNTELVEIAENRLKQILNMDKEFVDINTINGLEIFQNKYQLDPVCAYEYNLKYKSQINTSSRNFQKLETAFLNAKLGNDLYSTFLSKETSHYFAALYIEHLNFIKKNEQYLIEFSDELYKKNVFKYYPKDELDVLLFKWEYTNNNLKFISELQDQLNNLQSVDKNFNILECKIFNNKNFNSLDENGIRNLFLEQSRIIKNTEDSLLYKMVEIKRSLKDIEEHILSFWIFNGNSKIKNFKGDKIKTNRYSSSESLVYFKKNRLYSDSIKFFQLNYPLFEPTFQMRDTISYTTEQLFVLVGTFNNNTHYANDLDGYMIVTRKEKNDSLGRSKFVMNKSLGFRHDELQMDDEFVKVNIDNEQNIYAALFSDTRSNVIYAENRIVKYKPNGDTAWTCFIQTDKSRITGRCVFLNSDLKDNLYALYCYEYSEGGTFHLVKINKTTGKIIWIKEYIGDHVAGVLGGVVIDDKHIAMAINFTHNSSNRAVGKQFNPFILIMNHNGETICSKPVLGEEPKLILHLEKRGESFFATGNKGEYSTLEVGDFIHDRLLERKNRKNYYISFDLKGTILETNGME